MGNLNISELDNTDLAKRNIFVRPPEPPEDVLMADPTNAIYIGRTKIFHVPFYWTFQKTTNPHICIVGITGSGKSYFVKTFLTRASYVWGTNAFIIDWAGEYRDWVKQTGGKVISLGRGSAINLLDTAGMKPNDRIKQIMRTLDILTDVTRYPEQRRLTELAIEKAYVSQKFKLDSKLQVDGLGRPLRPPTLKDVQKILEDMSEAGSYEFPAELENAIYRLRQFTREGEDFFAQQSTIDLEKLTKGGLVDLDLSGLPDETFRGLAALSMLQFIKEKMREEGWSPTKGLKLLVVLDEAWKIAKDENSDAVMIVREGRKYQFGLIVASQNPTDISEAIFSNVGTTFILRVKFERFLDYLQSTLNFSDYMREEISKLGVGQAAVNMAFQATTDFSETFMIGKIDGEEPMQEFFLDMDAVLSRQELSMEGSQRSVGFEKDELKKKIRSYGLGEEQSDEIVALFTKKGRRMEIASFVVLLSRYGIARVNISTFLKELTLEDNVVISVLSKADELELSLGSEDISEHIMSLQSSQESERK
ncbi:TPA: ATP-binding protein [Candidatus Micrarchaeota archaeon]|nr:ATP-binding protein [Candidatus Micrarchaeota archaeon]HIH30880.1 ATP-binding protein [Candidatus Micrarchaeota archaeon]